MDLGTNLMPNNKSNFKHLSLKNRLLLTTTLWLSLMLVSAGLLIPYLINDYLTTDIKKTLSHSMDEIIANLEVDNNGKLVQSGQLSDPRFKRPYSGLYWYAESKKQTLRSRSLWDSSLQEKKHHYLGPNNEELITIKKSISLFDVKGPVSIVVGIDKAPLSSTIEQVMQRIWLLLSLLFIGVFTLISFQVKWSLKPLSKLQTELQKLRDGEQNALKQYYPNEIQPLVTDLNALVFHYQELLDRARHHAGNLSHALKTPLSILKNETETLPEEKKKHFEPALYDLQHHIDYHLNRARMAGSKHILSANSSPSKRIDSMSIAFDKLYSQHSILVINEIDYDLLVNIEQTDLDEILGNLLENGYKWATSIIRITANIVDDFVEINIEDDGLGIPENKFKEVLKRGIRLDESVKGTGLGLNIVQEVIHSYRGKLNISRSHLGGAKITVYLPLFKQN